MNTFHSYAFYPVERLSIRPSPIERRSECFVLIRGTMFPLTEKRNYNSKIGGQKRINEPRSYVKTWFLVERYGFEIFSNAWNIWNMPVYFIYKDVKNRRIRMYDQLSDPSTKLWREIFFFFSDAKVILQIILLS